MSRLSLRWPFRLAARRQRLIGHGIGDRAMQAVGVDRQADRLCAISGPFGQGLFVSDIVLCGQAERLALARQTAHLEAAFGVGGDRLLAGSDGRAADRLAIDRVKHLALQQSRLQTGGQRGRCQRQETKGWLALPRLVRSLVDGCSYWLEAGGLGGEVSLRIAERLLTGAQDDFWRRPAVDYSPRR